ncbi:MAG: hypothetical protein IJH31_05250 [Erysipelotrichaceae bacterium]|nr:hypothetical protein [Erysipelotrichaceae bacterium]
MKYFDIRELEIRGLKHIDNDANEYYRLPLNMIDKVNENVTFLAKETAGARIRFKTNSKNLHIKYQVNEVEGSLLMSGIANSFIGVYIDNNYSGLMAEDCISNKEYLEYKSSYFLDGQYHDVTIYLPIHSQLLSLCVGIDEDSEIINAKPYKYEEPVVFYGSSITQGLASSHAGASYVDKLCREVDCDYLNLGFSGSCKGETSIGEYIASLDMSAFVLDYDHNAPTIEHLRKTHEAFYRLVRDLHPGMPIILLSKPNFYYFREKDLIRREIIKQTYLNAKKRNENTYFIDGETYFGKQGRYECTVDGLHPNELGMEKMAHTIAPVLIKALEEDCYE